MLMCRPPGVIHRKLHVITIPFSGSVDGIVDGIHMAMLYITKLTSLYRLYNTLIIQWLSEWHLNRPSMVIYKAKYPKN